MPHYIFPDGDQFVMYFNKVSNQCFCNFSGSPFDESKSHDADKMLFKRNMMLPIQKRRR